MYKTIQAAVRAAGASGATMKVARTADVPSPMLRTVKSVEDVFETLDGLSNFKNSWLVWINGKHVGSVKQIVNALCA